MMAPVLIRLVGVRLGTSIVRRLHAWRTHESQTQGVVIGLVRTIFAIGQNGGPEVLQSIALPNSTRLPASPAERLTVSTNFEPSVSRTTSTETRTGPFSLLRTWAGPPT